MQKSELYSVRVCLRIVFLILFGLFIHQLPNFRTASIAVFGLFIPWTLHVARPGKGSQKVIRWQKVRASGIDPLSRMGTDDMHMGRLVTASVTTGWFDWIHGEVWIFPHGFLRIRSGLGQTLMNGFGPTVDRQQMNIQ